MVYYFVNGVKCLYMKVIDKSEGLKTTAEMEQVIYIYYIHIYIYIYEAYVSKLTLM